MDGPEPAEPPTGPEDEDASRPDEIPDSPPASGTAQGSPSATWPIRRVREGAEGSHSSSDSDLDAAPKFERLYNSSSSDSCSSDHGGNGGDNLHDPLSPVVQSDPQTPTSQAPYSLRHRYAGAHTAPTRQSHGATRGSGTSSTGSPGRVRLVHRRRRQYMTAVESQEPLAE